MYDLGFGKEIKVNCIESYLGNCVFDNRNCMYLVERYS